VTEMLCFPPLPLTVTTIIPLFDGEGPFSTSSAVLHEDQQPFKLGSEQHPCDHCYTRSARLGALAFSNSFRVPCFRLRLQPLDHLLLVNEMLAMTSSFLNMKLGFCWIRRKKCTSQFKRKSPVFPSMKISLPSHPRTTTLFTISSRCLVDLGT
jgi:hypothetical protein